MFWKRDLLIVVLLGLQTGCLTNSIDGPVKLRPFESLGPPPPEEKRAELKRSLKSKLDDGKIRLVHWQEGETTRDAMVRDGPGAQPPPLEVLQLANAVAPHRLSEIDGLAIVEGERRAAMARHGVDGTVHILIGQPPTSWDGQPFVTAEELSIRFGVGPVIGVEGRSWSQNELRSLSVALSFLSEDELLLLQNLPLVRGDKESSMLGLFQHFAQMTYGDGALYPSGSMEFFDLGSELDEYYIAGPPDQAYPYSCYVLVHEFGHAVSQMTKIALVNRHNENLSMYKVLVAAEKSSSLRRKLKMNRVERSKLMKKIEDQNRQVRKILRDFSPMARAYGELPGALPGPTPYARTNLEENFAEAFALYHMDPDALRRIAPQVLAWFESGQHIKSIDYSGWTQVTEELLRIKLESTQEHVPAPPGNGQPESLGAEPDARD